MYIPDLITVVINLENSKITIVDGPPGYGGAPLETRSVHIYDDRLLGDISIQVTFPGNVTRTYQSSQVTFELAPVAALTPAP